MRLVFPSLKNPKHRYCLYRRWSDNPTRQTGFDDRITAFDTYGDGDVQHCHEWSPQPDDCTDYLESLLLYLGSADESVVGEYTECWPEVHDSKDNRAIVEFASKPLFKDDNKSYLRYYNLREQKISTSDSKRHDKRWFQVESWMDGSFGAFVRLTKDERPMGLLGYYAWIRYSLSITDYSRYDFRSMQKIEPEADRRLWNAFEACEDYLLALKKLMRVRDWTKTRGENLRRQLEAKTEATAEAP